MLKRKGSVRSVTKNFEQMRKFGSGANSRVVQYMRSSSQRPKNVIESLHDYHFDTSPRLYEVYVINN